MPSVFLHPQGCAAAIMPISVPGLLLLLGWALVRLRMDEHFGAERGILVIHTSRSCPLMPAIGLGGHCVSACVRL